MPEDIDLFKRHSVSSISPFELNNEGKGKALVLRYAGCNLRCSLCYAWRYAWFPKRNGRPYHIQTSLEAINKLPSEIDTKKIVWVRIQGGEPCLNYDRILNTIEFAITSLKIIHQYGLNYYHNTRAVIQTNGIAFSYLKEGQKINIREQLRKSLSSLQKGKIVFEVSFKSPSDQKILHRQLLGFNVLLSQILIPLWNDDLDNIVIYPIAGLGPSIDFDNVWITPIDPSFLPQEIPLFHPKTWLPSFRNMFNSFVQEIIPSYSTYNEFRNNPRTNNGVKTAIEELEPTKFQTSWISGYAGGYRHASVIVTPIHKILRKLNNKIDPQWFALFKRYNHWMSVLNQIPTCENPSNLLSMIKNMSEPFYPSHPKNHYPYL